MTENYVRPRGSNVDRLLIEQKITNSRRSFYDVMIYCSAVSIKLYDGVAVYVARDIYRRASSVIIVVRSLLMDCKHFYGKSLEQIDSV